MLTPTRKQHHTAFMAHTGARIRSSAHLDSIRVRVRVHAGRSASRSQPIQLRLRGVRTSVSEGVHVRAHSRARVLAGDG